MPEPKTRTSAAPSAAAPRHTENRAALGAIGSAAEAFARHGLAAPPWTVAAPSFVIPGTVHENCALLRKSFPEVGLLLFETRACLDYGPHDLPGPDEFPELRFHAHLPLDLPWDAGLERIGAILAALVAKVAHLKPWSWVLHPPPLATDLAKLAQVFARRGVDPADVLLENTREQDLAGIWEQASRAGFSACLDLGHLLAYDQQDALALPGLWPRTRLLHLNAPGPGGRHESLARLDFRGRDTLAAMLARFTPGGVVLLEVFDPGRLEESLNVLAEEAGRILEHP